MKSKGWIDEAEKARIQEECKKVVVGAMKQAEAEKKPHIDHLFTDVYDTLPKHLQEQKQELAEHLKKYGQYYGLDQFSDQL